jgi:hypothetical protein
MQLSKKNFSQSLQPAPAWTAILGLICTITLFLLVNAGKFLIPLFPLASFGVGVFLYQRYPVIYVSYAWWMCFLAAFVRRLIDYQSGYTTFGNVSLAATLVLSITFWTVINNLPKVYNKGGFPFILSIGAVCYAFLIRLLRQPFLGLHSEIGVLLTWLSPILFGFHLYINWRKYPSYRKVIQQTFFWGVLVMGVYGVIQFLVAPQWDTQWLVLSGDNWMGTPNPLGIRVWSTMGNSMVFAFNMVPGLLLLLISRHKFRFVVAGFGYLAFLLSQVRTGWYCWLLGLLLLIPSLKGRDLFKLFVSCLSLLLIILPLLTIEPFSNQINDRLETFSNLESDGSAQVRVDSYAKTTQYALTEFIGIGIATKTGVPTSKTFFVDIDTETVSSSDNGLLQLFVCLGWLGFLPYLTGIIIIFFKLFWNSPSRRDIFAVTARSIALASLMRILTSTVAYSDYAMPIWGFLGIAMAAYKYHKVKFFARATALNS